MSEGDKLAKRPKGHVITGLLQNEMNGVRSNFFAVESMRTRPSLLYISRNPFHLERTGEIWKHAALKATSGFINGTALYFRQRWRLPDTATNAKVWYTYWALKVHLAWEEERNASQGEKFWKTIASQGKIMFDKQLLMSLSAPFRLYNNKVRSMLY